MAVDYWRNEAAAPQRDVCLAWLTWVDVGNRVDDMSFPNMIDHDWYSRTSANKQPAPTYWTLLVLKVRRVSYGIHFDHLWSTSECDLPNWAVIAGALRSARSPGWIPTWVPSLQGLIQLRTGRFKPRLSLYCMICMLLYALIKSWCMRGGAGSASPCQVSGTD